MILKRFYDEGLAHASFLIGCEKAGVCLILDPNRNLDQYMAGAAEAGLRIASVTETHIHADYLSGSRELALRTGANLYVSDEGDEDWKYALVGEPNVRSLRDHDVIEIGALRLLALHTPGHTPEHMSFLLSHESKPDEPLAAFTGDFIFVGDVGRPDLLENAAGIVGTAEPGARQLFGSLQRFRHLPPALRLWPGHGAGSACGKALGSAENTSLGDEMEGSWAFRTANVEAFVMEVLSGQPDPPPYFARMKRLNKTGPPIRKPRTLAKLDSPTQDTLILDARFDEEYQAAHFVNSLHIGSYSTFTGYAGWVVPFDTPIVLVASNEEQAKVAALNLSLIGIDDVVGWCGPEAIASAKSSQVRPTATTTSRTLDPKSLKLDVRNPGEWAEGHFENSVNIPFGHLARRIGELPRDRPIEVHCQGGARSAVACSILEREGYGNFRDIVDGFQGYLQSSALRLVR